MTNNTTTIPKCVKFKDLCYNGKHIKALKIRYDLIFNNSFMEKINCKYYCIYSKTTEIKTSYALM